LQKEVGVALENVKSEITGKVWKIDAKVGDQLAEEDPVLTLESMKMEIPVLAPVSGVLKEILVKEGQEVAEGQTVAVIES
jgi:acetyl-CoA carboxylase biotin carboxyl carrier protein